MIEIDDRDLQRVMREMGRVMRQSPQKTLKRELSKQLRGLMQPMVNRRKVAVLALPSKGHVGAGMRQAVARQIKAATRWSGEQAGVSIVQRARGMPRNFNMAGRAFNRAEGWNPKTLGGEVVHQQVKPVAWFDQASDTRETAEARQGIVNALEATAGKLASEIRSI